MIPPAKPDASAVVAFLEQLAKEPWLVDPERRKWPDYSFHVADIENAVGIFRQGRLLSRRRVRDQGVLINDHASEAIIKQTDAKWQEYVRLYFRPRTPTFYDNEGFRPARQLPYSDAHCRVPVALLFDARKLLTTQGVRFSDGSLARKETRIGDDAAFLRSLPFEQIYHDRAFRTGEDKTEIIRRRHAEIMVPDVLPLEGFLSWIFLRSEAELQTLLSLLEEDDIPLSDFWASRMRVALPGNLFYRRWTFVERVVATQNTIRIIFNPDTVTPYPFQIAIQLMQSDSQRIAASWDEVAADVRSPVTLRVPSQAAEGIQLFRVFLDGHLAYQSRLDLRSDSFFF